MADDGDSSMKTLVSKELERLNAFRRVAETPFGCHHVLYFHSSRETRE